MRSPLPEMWANKVSYYDQLIVSHRKECDSKEILAELEKLSENDSLRDKYMLLRNSCDMYHYKASKALDEYYGKYK